MTALSSFFSASTTLAMQRLSDPLYDQAAVEVHMVRTDRIHPQISGNKWFKLKYNLQQAQAMGCNGILSFGGAYSNHLHALAYAGHRFGLATVGIVRGAPEAAATPTLSDCTGWGMQLHFVDRVSYRQRHASAYLKTLQARFPGYYLVPEGGSNPLALKGVAEIPPQVTAELKRPPDFLVSACGTGGTLAGLIAGAAPTTQILGIPVLRGAEFLYADIERLLRQEQYVSVSAWSLDLAGHFGGYAKTGPELWRYMERFYRHHGVALEPVYTAKMMCRLEQLIRQGYFPPGSLIVALHTGGLQGLRGFARSHPAPC